MIKAGVVVKDIFLLVFSQNLKVFIHPWFLLKKQNGFDKVLFDTLCRPLCSLMIEGRRARRRRPGENRGRSHSVGAR